MIAVMFDTFEGLRDTLKSAVGDFDPATFDGAQAKRLVALFAEIKNLAAAGETLAMGRVNETGAWAAGADRSSEHWLSRISGVSISDARSTIDTAAHIGDLSATEHALRSGLLSPKQAALVVDAATVNPDAEARLLDAAAQQSFGGLRDEAQKVRLARISADAHAKIHARRSYRSWTDRDGAFRYEGTLTQSQGVGLDKVVDAYADAAYRAARSEGRTESHAAYASDAIIAIAKVAAAAARGTATPTPTP